MIFIHYSQLISIIFGFVWGYLRESNFYYVIILIYFRKFAKSCELSAFEFVNFNYFNMSRERASLIQHEIETEVKKYEFVLRVLEAARVITLLFINYD